VLIEAPYVLQAANLHHVHLGWVVQIYNAAEALPNLVNPFWMLPLLGILKLKARDLVGYSVLQLIVHVPVVFSCAVLRPVIPMYAVKVEIRPHRKEQADGFRLLLVLIPAPNLGVAHSAWGLSPKPKTFAKYWQYFQRQRACFSGIYVQARVAVAMRSAPIPRAF